MKLPVLESLLAASRAGTPMALVTQLSSGAQATVTHAGVGGDLTLDDTSLSHARRALDDDQCLVYQSAAGPLFIETWNPPPRLLIVGAVHTAQALIPLAQLAGYAVTVIDPRTAFATADRFPGVTLRHDWPDAALAALAPDRRTALVTLSHDPKIDDPALEFALRCDAFYIGALGSRRTHGKRVERLRQAGFDATAIERIHAPVGLAIGARSPAEIAISIMAEITAVRHRAPLGTRAT